MEKIENQREKLVISFNGCTKDDTDKRDKSNSTDRIGTNKATFGTKSHSNHSDHISLQPSYKF